MEMRIVVPGATSLGALAERLAIDFGSERISLSRSGPEIGVRITDELDRTVLGVLDSVERWLDQAGVASAEMWLGTNSYRLARWAPVEVAQRPHAARRRSSVAKQHHTTTGAPVRLGV